jgi:hypothetical protein
VYASSDVCRKCGADITDVFRVRKKRVSELVRTLIDKAVSAGAKYLKFGLEHGRMVAEFREPWQHVFTDGQIRWSYEIRPYLLEAAGVKFPKGTKTATGKYRHRIDEKEISLRVVVGPQSVRIYLPHVG